MRKPPWPLKALVWYYRRTYLGFGLLLLIAALWGLTSRTGGVIFVSGLVAPWIFLFLVILNVPFVGALVRRFRLSQAERRNHALEHGTIHFLLLRRGDRRGVGGQASAKGFRISGAKNKAEIERAFRDFIAAEETTKARVVVSNHCGSMLVIAQGVGVVLLLLTLVGFTIWPPSLAALVCTLVLQVVLFGALRRPLGRLIQRRRLLLLDFSRAAITGINGVRRNAVVERGPVFFVRTYVS